MKTKIIILGFLLLNTFALQATEKLQGKWTVEQITIVKNIDGKSDTTVYKTATDVKSNIPCPQKWNITEKNVVLTYPNGKEETIAYIIEDDRLILLEDSMVPYLYSTNENVLTLTTVTEYIYESELPSGTKRVEEKWIIKLKKQNK